MNKSILIIAGLLFLSFNTSGNTDTNVDVKESDKHIVREINAFNEIINIKLEKIKFLETSIKSIAEENNTAKKAALLEEIHLQKMMILKYKAAIACRENFLAY